MRRNKIEAIKTARVWLEKSPVYLDAETTGMGNSAEIVDLAVIDTDGTVLINTLIKPTVQIEKRAKDIHGILANAVEDAPGFNHILPDLDRAVKNRMVLIFNADFDLRLIRQSAEAHGTITAPGDAGCVMKLYAEFYGDWNDYRGNYKRQSQAKAARQLGLELPKELHRAQADAQLCRAIVEAMAATRLPGEAE